MSSTQDKPHLLPACTVKAADWEVAPVWSRSNSPRDVPPGSATVQVNEVPVSPDQEKRAGEEGLPPGTTLYIEDGRINTVR